MDGVRSGGGGVVSLGLGSGPRHRACLGLLPGLAVGLLLQRLRDDVGHPLLVDLDRDNDLQLS